MTGKGDYEVSTRPYLNRFAIDRTDSSDIDGFYSEQDAMWVIETEHGIEPIIESTDSSMELVTKTAAQVEQDDRHPFAFELATKTDAIQESDDKAANSSFLLEVSTKTEAQLESDDTILESRLFM